MSKHLKRIAMPKTWKLERKKEFWVTKPMPGAHNKLQGMALETALKELIKCAKTRKEVRIILNKKDILVDGKKRKELKLPVGLMDVVSIPEIKENYRILLDKKGNLYALKIDEEDASIKPCKIIGKKTIKKGITQLNLFGSRNILVKKGGEEYKVGDTLVISLPKQEVKEHLKLEKGNVVYLMGGKYIGNVGIIEKLEGDKITIKIDDVDVTTKKDYAIVIGKSKPLIKITS
ncbi:MAG: 30S ribosomal protein S4e [Candidatus Woesearchaeota archaeon]|nr:30S ribosomal protein S4e [Candidatus Woesearchaeota archaeon]